jgi:hypothetical protein
MSRGCFEYDALGTLEDAGITHLDICCVGTRCMNRNRVAVAALIERLGAGTPLVMIARAARCKVCRHRGAHVQPTRPDPHDPSYPEAKLRSFTWGRAAR